MKETNTETPILWGDKRYHTWQGRKWNPSISQEKQMVLDL